MGGGGGGWQARICGISTLSDTLVISRALESFYEHHYRRINRYGTPHENFFFKPKSRQSYIHSLILILCSTGGGGGVIDTEEFYARCGL